MSRDWADHDLRFVVAIALATVPLIVAGLILSPILNACNSPLRSLSVIGFACIVMSLLLILAELVASHARRLASATFADAMVIGVAQVVRWCPAFPGRHLMLTAALFLGFERTVAARYSFLLGLPAIFLAGARELWILHKAGLSLDGWLILLTGLGGGQYFRLRGDLAYVDPGAVCHVALRHLPGGAGRRSSAGFAALSCRHLARC